MWDSQGDVLEMEAEILRAIWLGAKEYARRLI